MIVCLIIVYTIPLIYVYRKRNFAETRARSPITTTLCILLIMLDSIFNTWIFSIKLDPDQTPEELAKPARLQCLLGVWVTMVLMVPILLTMYIRIYRVKRVFELYEKFLDRISIRSGSIYSFARSYNTRNLGDAIRNSLDNIKIPDLKDGNIDSNWRQTEPYVAGTLPNSSRITHLKPAAASDHLSSGSDTVRFRSENYEEKQSLLSTEKNASPNKTNASRTEK